MFKRSKYGAKKVEVDGIKFDSKREYNKYSELKLLETNGEIFNLRLQVPFILQDKFINGDGIKIREIKYIADFVYEEKDGTTVVADSKGFAKNPLYIAKKKLFEKVHYPLTIKEV